MFLKKQEKTQELFELVQGASMSQVEQFQDDIIPRLKSRGIDVTPETLNIGLEKAASAARAARTAKLTAAIEAGYVNGEPPDQVAQKVAPLAKDPMDTEHQDLALDAEELTPSSSVTLRRRMIFNRMVSKEMEDTGLLSLAGDFLDMAVSSGINSVVDFFGADRGSGFNLEEDIQEVIQAQMNPNISDKEAEDLFKRKINKWKDSGLFTDANILYLSTLLQAVNEGPDSLTAKIEWFFSILDVATLGATTATKAVKAARAAKAGLSSVAASSALSAGESKTAVHGVGGIVSRANNETAKLALDLKDKRIFSSVAEVDTEDAIKALQKEIKVDKRRFRDASVVEDQTGNKIVRIVLGKTDGNPWYKKEAAEKLAQQIGGRVEEIQPDKFVVVYDRHIDFTKGIDPTNVNELFSGTLLSKVTSTRFNTEVRLDNLLKTGEAYATAVASEIKQAYTKARKKLSKEELLRVDETLRRMRDDPAYAELKASPDHSEFIETYQTIYGKAPSKKEVDFYASVKQLDELEYSVIGDKHLKEAIANRELVIESDTYKTRAKEVTEISPEEEVFDLSLGRPVKASEVKSKIFLVKDNFNTRKNKYRYVTRPKTTRPLEISDLVPYRLGGHRYYNTPTRFFVKGKQGDELHAFMGTFTEAEAKAATRQINEILEKKTDEAVLLNNDWNPDLETYDDFVEFLKKYGMDPEKVSEVKYFADGDSYYKEGQFKEHFIYANATGRRDRPLIGYGGSYLGTESPLSVIERSAIRSVEYQADAKYLYNAVVGWLKAAEEAGVLKHSKSLENVASPLQKFRLAELDKGKKVSKALEVERETILRRMNQLSRENSVWMRLMTTAAEFAFDKDMPKLTKLFEKWANGDPTAFLRWLAFNAKLGFWNIKQLWLQFGQALNASAIVSANIGLPETIRTVAGVPLFRVLLIDKVPEKARKMIASVLGKTIGLSESEVLTIVDWTKYHGRNIVSGTFIEEMNPSGSIITSKAKELVDYGQVFFKEGELSSRLAAVLLSFKEMKKKLPKFDPFDPEITQKLIGRQDVLIASMTKASASQLQKTDIGATALQFTSYTMHMFEQLMSGRILTKQERLRLGLAQLVFYGLSGAVPLYIADYVAETYGPDSEEFYKVYNSIRRGAIDWLLNNIFGADTDVSQVMSIYGGGADRVYNLLSNSLIEASPPSVSIGVDFLNPLWSFTKHAVKGEVDLLSYDIVSLGRNISSFDQTYRAYMAFKLKEIRSRKTGALLRDDPITTEAILQAFGVPSAKVNDLYVSVMTSKIEKEARKKIEKKIEELMHKGNKALDAKDYDTYNDLMQDVGALLQFIPPNERLKTLKAIDMRLKVPMSDRVLAIAVKKDNPALYERIK